MAGEAAHGAPVVPGNVTVDPKRHIERVICGNHQYLKSASTRSKRDNAFCLPHHVPKQVPSCLPVRRHCCTPPRPGFYIKNARYRADENQPHKTTQSCSNPKSNITHSPLNYNARLQSHPHPTTGELKNITGEVKGSTTCPHFKASPITQKISNDLI